MPNPSFELESCEEMNDWFENGITGWYNVGLGTSDIYNSCTVDGVGVPSNFAGWQDARTGVGYAGLIPYEDLYFMGDTGWFVDSREYIQIELIEPLVKDAIYAVSFFVSVADNYATCFTSGIGVYLSSEQIDSDVPFELFDYPSQIYSTEILTDSISWTEIGGEFTANGGEIYLTIGCFKHDSEIEIDCFPDTVTQRNAYYYIDDVSVVLESVNYLLEVPNIFTPNNDNDNDYFEIITNGYTGVDVHVYNRWGIQVFTSISLDFKWNGTDLSNGVYYYTLELERIDGSIDYKKGYVQLIR